MYPFLPEATIFPQAPAYISQIGPQRTGSVSLLAFKSIQISAAPINPFKTTVLLVASQPQHHFFTSHFSHFSLLPSSVLSYTSRCRRQHSPNYNRFLEAVCRPFRPLRLEHPSEAIITSSPSLTHTGCPEGVSRSALSLYVIDGPRRGVRPLGSIPPRLVELHSTALYALSSGAIPAPFRRDTLKQRCGLP